MVQIRGVYGSDGNGATYAGAAASVHWARERSFPAKPASSSASSFVRPMFTARPKTAPC